jgi:FtsH-binding integral membrane protein
MDVKLYVRDVAIVILLSFVGGFIGGFILGVARINEPEIVTIVIAIISIVSTVAGFWIVGCLSKKSTMQRFNYLGYVGISVWLFGLINILIGLSNITQWVLSVIFVLICLAIGGGLSLLTCKVKIEETIN